MHRHALHFRLLVLGMIFATAFTLIKSSPSTGALTYGDNLYNNVCSYGCAGPIRSSPKNSAATGNSTAPKQAAGASFTSTSTGTSTSTDLDPFPSFANGSGQLIDLTQGETYRFTIASSNSNGANGQKNSIETHTVTISGVTSDSVTLIIASTPKQYVLHLNEKINVDVNSDASNDLGIEVMAINPPSAKLRFWRIITVTSAPNNAYRAVDVDVANFRQPWATLTVILGFIIILMVLPHSFYKHLRILIDRHRSHRPHYHTRIRPISRF